MNRKGFTLIELIATIALVCVLATVTITVSVKKVNESKQKSLETMIESIELSAKDYVIDNENILTEFRDNDSINITLETLIENEYFDKELINPVTKVGLPLTDVVYVRRTKKGKLTSTYNVDQRNEPRLIVVLNGGEISETLNDTYKPREGVVLGIPTKTGTTFAGWTVSGEGARISGGVIPLLTMGTSDTTVTANWGIYPELIVDLDGGNGQTFNERYAPGSIIPLEVPTRTLNSFAGWTVSGTGASISEGIIPLLTMGTDTTTLTANWTSQNYVQTYSYTGNYEKWIAPADGYYKIELWGGTECD